MDIPQWSAKMRTKRPADGRADISRPEIIKTVLWIAHHNRKVLGDILKENMERMGRRQIRLIIQKSIDEHRIGLFQRKLARIANTQILQRHFHELAAGYLRTRGVIQDTGSVFGQEGFSLLETVEVVLFEFDPEIGFEF